MESVDVANERRVEAVADQFLHSGRECAGEVGWDRQCHILDLAHPGLAVLRCDPKSCAPTAMCATS
ncbi:MAG: hypothetical protein ACRD0I_01235, partial [Acidimicrobiales bacterium]